MTIGMPNNIATTVKTVRLKMLVSRSIAAKARRIDRPLAIAQTNMAETANMRETVTVLGLMSDTEKYMYKTIASTARAEDRRALGQPFCRVVVSSYRTFCTPATRACGSKTGCPPEVRSAKLMESSGFRSSGCSLTIPFSDTREPGIPVGCVLSIRARTNWRSLLIHISNGASKSLAAIGFVPSLINWSVERYGDSILTPSRTTWRS